MKRGILLICIMLSLTACSKNVNEHIRQQYNLSEQKTENGVYSSGDYIADEYIENEQSSKAMDNGNKVYDILYDTNTKQYNSFFSIAGDDDTPLSKRLVLAVYAAYAEIKHLAPYIGMVSVSVGVLIFIFSKYNKGLRRFALYGLIIAVPCMLLFIIFGYGILADIFMY